mmetsp:Transcript_72289/g.212159  ORF Transcript_72289/g.212159 Transcript_72289/m.212159 type:complete len:234 (-) Transcript_72289:23-724(-)
MPPRVREPHGLLDFDGHGRGPDCDDHEAEPPIREGQLAYLGLQRGVLMEGLDVDQPRRGIPVLPLVLGVERPRGHHSRLRQVPLHGEKDEALRNDAQQARQQGHEGFRLDEVVALWSHSCLHAQGHGCSVAVLRHSESPGTYAVRKLALHHLILCSDGRIAIRGVSIRVLDLHRAQVRDGLLRKHDLGDGVHSARRSPGSGERIRTSSVERRRSSEVDSDNLLKSAGKAATLN